MISDEKKQEIINKLNQHLGNFQCPMCKHTEFTIVDGYMLPQIQENIKSFNITAPYVPSIAIICLHCGFISIHSLGVLGMLPQQIEGQTEDA